MGPSRRLHRATTSLSLLLLLSYISVLLPAACAISTSSVEGSKEFITFSYPNFEDRIMQLAHNLTFSGESTTFQKTLQITPIVIGDDPQSFLVNRTGSVFFASPFVLWEASKSTAHGSRHVASFSTAFEINIVRVNKSIKGEGLAFVIASSGDRDPPPGSDGGYLGLTNSSTDGNATNGFAAVELDTVKQAYDPDDNHVGLDVNGVRSIIAASLTPFGIELAPMRNTGGDHGTYIVWIEYNGESRQVSVYIANNGSKPATAVLHAPLDLSTILHGNKAYFGFSASTGAQYQFNEVNSWNMTVERLADGSKKPLSGWKVGLAIGVPCAVPLVLGLLAVLICIRKKRQVGYYRAAIDLRSIPGVPKEFEYKELRDGTNNFDEKMRLGQGGYGVVYRATVLGESGRSTEVAVKRFSAANTKGRDDFLAELNIINCLRHRNLVKLVGWCHHQNVLLLVYELMPNGSLDKHILGGRVLNWEQRYNIVVGVASAINYLHREYGQMVIHRDIKPSNIMLDAELNARLGDFGLARALDTSYTDKISAGGTIGYIAPECFVTNRATRESDVYAFGAVVLEVVCGCRIGQLLQAVWKLHSAGSGRILEAVDPRLTGQFDNDDAERLLLLGLACIHPSPGERPGTQGILRILTRSASPPDVPPSNMWSAVLAHEDETSSGSAVTNTVFFSARDMLTADGKHYP